MSATRQLLPVLDTFSGVVCAIGAAAVLALVVQQRFDDAVIVAAGVATLLTLRDVQLGRLGE